MLHYLLHENPNDNSIAADLGFSKPLVSLVVADDVDIRQTALRNLVEMARNEKFNDHAEEKENTMNLRRALESRIEQIRSMDPEELSVVKEERALIDSLWEMCFHEPSLLREGGFVVLPSDEEPPPPDVTSKLFEPALRAWAAPRQTMGSQNQEETATSMATKPPLLLGG